MSTIIGKEVLMKVKVVGVKNEVDLLKPDSRRTMVQVVIDGVSDAILLDIGNRVTFWVNSVDHPLAPIEEKK